MTLAILLLLAAAPPENAWQRLQAAVENHLGRPYSWGATGLKSFDCSGFVWRVMYDNGILVKRTTARKLWFSLPSVPPEEHWKAGNLVFFDNLKHVGIVNGPTSFYHAESRVGTNLSKFDPYWRKKVSGMRRIPRPGD